ncbi:hypothetical protein WISP_22667 [Willisornis vidua]|uniref:Uncharacterized protein n=1 Tax=Willisornis vidua TaxID=1566151 RepID=A0ABQ9DTP6_9PASS|nr:hypothetical protein WISP_22667 [Willisornis vidua]
MCRDNQGSSDRRAALNQFIPQPVLIPVPSTQVQHLALGFIKSHKIHMGPLLELVQVPLDGISSFREKADLLNTFLSSVFTAKASPWESLAQKTRVKVWQKADFPFIENSDEGPECLLGKFPEDTKLGGVANIPKCCAEGPWQIGEMGGEELPEIQQRQMQVLHLVKNNATCQYKLGTSLLKNSSEEKNLVVMVDNKLSISQQCVLVAK